MAADLIESAEAKFPGSESLKRAKRFEFISIDAGTRPDF